MQIYSKQKKHYFFFKKEKRTGQVLHIAAIHL